MILAHTVPHDKIHEIVDLKKLRSIKGYDRIELLGRVEIKRRKWKKRAELEHRGRPPGADAERCPIYQGPGPRAVWALTEKT